MKKWILFILATPMVSLATTQKTTLVAKTVEATLVFQNEHPFNSQNEHGGYCYETTLDFLSIYTITKYGKKEFMPILDGRKYFSNQCGDDSNWDMQNKLVDSLNSHVTIHHFVHELKIKASYAFEQEETDDMILLKETISFHLPELNTPFVFSQSKRIWKRQALFSKSYCDKDKRYRIEMLPDNQVNLKKHPLFPNWEIKLVKESDTIYIGQNGYVFSELRLLGGDVYRIDMGEFSPHGEIVPTESVILNQQNCI